MKRFISMIVCLSLLATVAVSAVAFAKDSANPTSISQDEGKPKKPKNDLDS